MRSKQISIGCNTTHDILFHTTRSCHNLHCFTLQNKLERRKAWDLPAKSLDTIYFLQYKQVVILADQLTVLFHDNLVSTTELQIIKQQNTHNTMMQIIVANQLLT